MATTARPVTLMSGGSGRCVKRRRAWRLPAVDPRADRRISLTQPRGKPVRLRPSRRPPPTPTEAAAASAPPPAPSASRRCPPDEPPRLRPAPPACFFPPAPPSLPPPPPPPSLPPPPPLRPEPSGAGLFVTLGTCLEQDPRRRRTSRPAGTTATRPTAYAEPTARCEPPGRRVPGRGRAGPARGRRPVRARGVVRAPSPPLRCRPVECSGSSSSPAVRAVSSARHCYGYADDARRAAGDRGRRARPAPVVRRGADDARLDPGAGPGRLGGGDDWVVASWPDVG